MNKAKGLAHYKFFGINRNPERPTIVTVTLIGNAKGAKF